jgi:hypothetical protein
VRRAETQDTIGITIGIAATSSPKKRMSNRPSGEPRLVWGEQLHHSSRWDPLT